MGTDDTTFEFTAQVFQWRGPSPYYFAAMPDDEGRDVKALADGYGWGMVPIMVRLGGSTWKTSLWQKDGGYLVPLKDAVRKVEKVDDGDTVTIRFTPLPPKPKPARSSTVRRRAARVTIDVNQLTIRPANQSSWADLRTVFGSRGEPSRCWCQRFRMVPHESWASVGPEELADRLREQTACEHPRAKTSTGLVAYVDDEAVGWCAIAPRSDHPRLLRNNPTPWDGRNEDKTDPAVWALTCFVTRAGYGRQGISQALARAAVEYARGQGADAIEGYPDLTGNSHLGNRNTFVQAGFAEVSRPSINRVVMRIDF